MYFDLFIDYELQGTIKSDRFLIMQVIHYNDSLLSYVLTDRMNSVERNNGYIQQDSNFILIVLIDQELIFTFCFRQRLCIDRGRKMCDSNDIRKTISVPCPNRSPDSNECVESRHPDINKDSSYRGRGWREAIYSHFLRKCKLMKR